MKFLILVCFLFLVQISLAVDFTCDFEEFYDKNSSESFYKCNGKSLSVINRATVVTLKSPNHLHNKSNADVNFLFINKQIVEFFPRLLEKNFPNLAWVAIKNSGLKEIHRIDLETFEKLKVLELQSNLIEYLEKDLFKANQGLELIDFRSNKISFISPTIFDGLKGLKILILRENLCINEDAKDDQKDDDLVQKLINRTKFECSDPLTLIQKVFITQEGLKLKFEELEGKNDELIDEISKLKVSVSSMKNKRVDSNDAKAKNVSVLVIIPIVVLMLIIVSGVLLIKYKKKKRNEKLKNDESASYKDEEKGEVHNTRDKEEDKVEEMEMKDDLKQESTHEENICKVEVHEEIEI